MRLFDRYSLKAIYIPTVILLTSPILTVYLLIVLHSMDVEGIADSMRMPPKTLTSLVPVLLYFIGLTVVRTGGRRKQEVLLQQWGGFPTTRFLRHSDGRFSEEMKRNLKEVIGRRFNISLLDPEEEAREPREADKRIADAFVLVKDWLRKNDREAFWQKHNIDYGFYRNLWGSGWLWIFLNVVFLVLSIALFLVYKSTALLYPIVLNAVLSLVSLLIVTFYVPNATKFSAEQYAESAWSAFYNLNRS